MTLAFFLLMTFMHCWEDRKCSRSCAARDNGDIFCWRSKPSQGPESLHLCDTCEYRLSWLRGEYSVADFLQRSDRRAAPRTQKRVLVIEDEPSILFAFEETVRLMGHACISAVDGEEGLILSKGARPDLLITDIVLPRVNGLDLFRRLRRDPATSALPVIVVTARNSKDDARACRDLGAEALLLKPFSLTTLTAHIEHALSAGVKPAASA